LDQVGYVCVYARVCVYACVCVCVCVRAYLQSLPEP
jgi:hypothetical protein